MDAGREGATATPLTGVTGLLHAFWDSTGEAAADHAPDFPLTDIAQDHQRVLDALVAQDIAAATQAMHDHFEPLIRASRRSGAAAT